ncbi:DUF2786 domain-containing protein [Streptacidiphilus fuscans]|uniref:DUF2786 domain-containing protein n=1 Tax=Streptacidiphilus fuscans TaxID=2789292 RepID=A0A931B2A9_9ACTN|nr:DUF2786 domain-containing protein [Streptacidiphilus fuscans]MBF9067942.1 DUF2786 domain-containing protein [Streptacidiphilus fuscans]
MRDHSPSPAELVASATALATGATPAQSERAVEDAASLLAAQTGVRAGVDRALLNHGETLLGTLWRNHWRPADAVRVVRRELGAAHLAFAVALVAAEARRYPQAALDRRWTEQLRELEATTWQGPEDAWLDEVADRHRLDRFSALTALLELVRLWSWLPRLTEIGPVPAVGSGSATVTALTAPVPGEPKLLARIRALLAKAESTDYAEEAEAFTAKAQELMARHSIDEALLAARSGDRTLPGAIRIGIDNPYESAKALLLDAVADANRARSVWDKANGFCTVVGFDADLDAVELLYTSLLVQAVTAMNGAQVQRRGRTKAFRQSFLVSYASRIRERLSTATAQAQKEAVAETGTSDLLPVLAARQEAVERHTTTLFPSLKKGRSIRVSDYDGWEQGRAAANRAQLHSPQGRGELRG